MKTLHRVARVAMSAVIVSAAAIALTPSTASATTNAIVVGAKPTANDFGNVAVGKTKTKTISVTINSGYTGIVSGGGGASPPLSVNPDTCLGAVGPTTCQVEETFTPTTAGAAAGVLELDQCSTSPAVCETVVVPLAGVGTQKGSTDPVATLNFGDVKLGTTKTMTQKLSVSAGMQVQGVAGSGLSAPFTFRTGTCFFFTRPGTCKFSEDYEPTLQTADAGTVTLTVCPVVPGPPCTTPTFDVVGNGLTEFSGKPTVVSFGNVAVGKSKTKSITVTIDAGQKLNGLQIWRAGAQSTVGVSGCG